METTLPAGLVEEVHGRLRALYGGRLRHTLLYGSHARGEAHSESDIDVLVILKGPVRSGAEASGLSDLRMDVLARYAQLLSVHAVSEKRFATEDWPFFRNVREEGVPLETLLSRGDGHAPPRPLPPLRASRSEPGVMKSETQKLLARARQTLEAAYRDLAYDDYDRAMSAAYYAVFYAATAALNEEGLAAKSHRGTHDLFYKTYVAPGRVADDLGGVYSDLKDWRVKADYNTEPGFSHADAEGAAARAERFIEAVENVLNPPA